MEGFNPEPEQEPEPEPEPELENPIIITSSIFRPLPIN